VRKEGEPKANELQAHGGESTDAAVSTHGRKGSTKGVVPALGLTQRVMRALVMQEVDAPCLCRSAFGALV